MSNKQLYDEYKKEIYPIVQSSSVIMGEENKSLDQYLHDYNNPNRVESLNIISVTPTNSKITNYAGFGNTYYYKIGSKVHVHVGVKVDNGGSSTWESVFTLPSGYRPIGLVYTLGTGSTFQIPAGMIVNPSGIVNVSTTSGCRYRI